MGIARRGNLVSPRDRRQLGCRRRGAATHAAAPGLVRCSGSPLGRGCCCGAIVPRVGLTFGAGLAAVVRAAASVLAAGIRRGGGIPGAGSARRRGWRLVGAPRWARRPGVPACGRRSARPRLLGPTLARRQHAKALRGFRLPVAVALLPLAVVAVDWLLGFVIRRRGVRLTLEVAAAAVALAVLGSPLSTRARSSIVSSQRASADGDAGRLPGLAGHDARRPPLDVRLRATEPRTRRSLRRGCADLHAGALDCGMDAAGSRVDADRTVSEPARRASGGRLARRASRSTGDATSPIPLAADKHDARRAAARPRLRDGRLRRELLVPLSRLRPGAGLPGATRTRPGCCSASGRRWRAFVQQRSSRASA